MQRSLGCRLPNQKIIKFTTSRLSANPLIFNYQIQLLISGTSLIRQLIRRTSMVVIPQCGNYRVQNLELVAYLPGILHVFKSEKWRPTK